MSPLSTATLKELHKIPITGSIPHNPLIILRSNDEGWGIEFAGNAGEIGVRSGAQIRVMEPTFAIFRGEYDMQINAGEGNVFYATPTELPGRVKPLVNPRWRFADLGLLSVAPVEQKPRRQLLERFLDQLTR